MRNEMGQTVGARNWRKKQKWRREIYVFLPSLSNSKQRGGNKPSFPPSPPSPPSHSKHRGGKKPSFTTSPPSQTSRSEEILPPPAPPSPPFRHIARGRGGGGPSHGNTAEKNCYLGRGKPEKLKNLRENKKFSFITLTIFIYRTYICHVHFFCDPPGWRNKLVEPFSLYIDRKEPHWLWSKTVGKVSCQSVSFYVAGTQILSCLRF